MSTSRNPLRHWILRPGQAAWRSVRGMTVLVVMLALLVVGGAVVAVAGGLRAYQQSLDTQARNAALSAAKTTVSNFMSVSAKSVDRDLKRTLDGSTGDFRREYQNGMKQTRSAVVENKVSARAQVLWAGVTTSKRKSATVLVAMDATVRNTNAPDGRKAHYRVRVVMSEQSHHWLVSKLEFV